MYKLYLSLKYLVSRAIGVLAFLAVGLCVAMMIIAISIMTGFLDKIENAAKGLFGDIVIESASQHGLPLYEEFIDHLEEKVPEVRHATPFVLSYGLLRIPDAPEYRQKVTIAGVRLPDYATVSQFEGGLFAQDAERPTFNPDIARLIDVVDADRERIEQLYRQAQANLADPDDPHAAEIVRLADNSLVFHQTALRSLRQALPYQQRLADAAGELERARRRFGADSDEAFAAAERLEDLTFEAGFQPPGRRAILGLGIPGLSARTPDGQTLRNVLPGHRIILWIFPLGGRVSETDLAPNKAALTVVDDCRTDVWSIDSEFVYMPFETLQRLNNMDARYAADDPNVVVQPARCSSIFLTAEPRAAAKRAAEYAGDGPRPSPLEAVAWKVRDEWRAFTAGRPEGGLTDVTVMTWRQRQERVIWPIRQQRILVMVMFGIISGVAVFLIGVILYMIVLSKTHDIGVLKAVGASSGGVAGIFLLYGIVIGLAGSLLGTVGAWVFVKNINPIHDWAGRALGFQVWSREVFLFERIPNDVDWRAWVWIVAGSMVAGLIGAIIPALRAASMQPVEALRYE